MSEGPGKGQVGPPLIPGELLPLFTDNGEFMPDRWWWSFDTFLVGLVQIAADKLLRDGNGYPCPHWVPGDPGCDCEQEWQKYLEGIRDDLRDVREALIGYDKFASTATAEQQQRVQAALHRFVDRLGSWWD